MHVLCDCYDLDTLPYTFDHIWTNLLTQCTPVPVPIFCCFSILGFPLIKSTRKIPGKYRKNQHTGSFAKSPRGARGEPGGPRRTVGAAPPLAAPGGRLEPLVHLWLSPFAYLFPVTRNPRGRNPFS